jgi:hypothetical protein
LKKKINKKIKTKQIIIKKINIKKQIKNIYIFFFLKKQSTGGEPLIQSPRMPPVGKQIFLINI